MQCPKCRFENREHVKFCEECGTKMERVFRVAGQKPLQDRNIAANVAKLTGRWLSVYKDEKYQATTCSMCASEVDTSVIN